MIMEEERRRKIEAGKATLDKFKKKKKRYINSPTSSISSSDSHKSCSIILGARKDENANLNNQEKALMDNFTTENANSNLTNSPVKASTILSTNQCSSDSSSLESFLVEGTIEDIEASSGSDNTTITRNSSDSSKSCSTTENENTPHIRKGKLFQFGERSESTVPSDCRPDDEKIFEISLTEEKEKEVSEMERSLDITEKMAEVISSGSRSTNQEKEAFEVKDTLNTKENFMKFPLNDFKTNNKETELPQFLFGEEIKTEKNYAMDIALKDNSLKLNDITVDKDLSLIKQLSIPEPDDDHVSLLNADDTELVSLYDKKIEKYQEAIQQRDIIILQLSNRLESVIANQDANLTGNSQVDILQDEINLLHLKMKETSELLKKQKLKNGNQEFENCSSQTDVQLFRKSEAGVQVEMEMKSLLEYSDLSDIAFSDIFGKIVSTNSKSLHEIMLRFHQFLTSQFSRVQIQELITLLKTDTNLSEFDPMSEKNEASVLKNRLQISEKLDSTAILKKIISLNMVAKVIESLVSLSSGDANETFLDFSPSKFQSFFLKRMHSVEGGDTLPDTSENESIVSDYNYAEVEPPCLKRDFESSVSIEKLRKRNICEDFYLVTEFLEDEMDRLCNFLPLSLHSVSQSEEPEPQESLDSKECLSTNVKINQESEYKQILLHKLKLETRLKNFKLLDKQLHNFQPVSLQASTDSDIMAMSEDNIMMEKPPLSCISLLSLTDSEYKGENVVTDSETNYSRKVSIDMSRSMQDRDFCLKCERTYDLWKEKYENDVVNMKASLESSYNTQKNEFLESIKILECEIEQLKMDKKNLNEELNQQIELLCSENKMKISHLMEQHQQKLEEVTLSQNKYCVENKELETKLNELKEKLACSNRKIMDTADEKAKIEIELQNQIADLIQEHEQDMESLKVKNETKFNLEKEYLENHYKSSVEILKNVHGNEINELKCQIKKEFEEKEQSLLNEHSKTISLIEAAHNDESAVYQKKIEQLLEEKCELLTKTTHEYETILKKNHKALVILCKQLLSKINVEKEKLLNESLKSCSGLEISFSGAFNELNRDLENGLFKFLNQNYFMNLNNEEFNLDDTEYLPIEINYPLDEDKILKKSDLEDAKNIDKKIEQIIQNKQDFKSSADVIPLESSLDSDDLYTIHAEINKLQEEFQKDVAFYKNVNDELHLEMKALRKQIEELKEQKEHVEIVLKEKEKDLVSKESLLTTMDTAAVKDDTQLSATDIRSWQVQAAQTNSRLLHVLSDLVKTFLDIENDINSHLLEYGLIPSRTGILNQHDDDTGQSVGSREDFASLSLGDCPNLELTEDGPDLTPRAWDVFITAGNYEADLEGEDVVLGASRRLRMAVDHVLNLLSRALENQQNQDLKLLLKRNEELSHELQEESQGRDAVNMELLTAESAIRKLESEKQQLQDLHTDLKDDCDVLKRELSVERNKISHLQQEKESAFDEIHVLKEQCELLASRLGDPEKTENDKMFSSSGTCMHENSELLQENSRLSSEKQTVQKNLSKERQSFLDRLHQMEIALEELNAEKDDLMEKKCKEIRDLKAEMEAMEKQLHSNRKFIEEQALEREQEREEFIKEINKMQDFVKEKEKIQSNEAQLTKEIESLEQLLRVRIEDHKNAMAKKDEVEKELRQSLDKIRDLRDVIEEYGKQIDIKTKTEAELRQKLSVIYESIPYQEKNASNSDSDSSRNVHANGESNEYLHNLKEQLQSQSQEIEIMSQSQTLLHELRGQIHFLEAKVEQRAKQLETSILSSASSPVQSGATSPSGSQDSESLQIPCEDGWQMSPRSIHWLEVRRLEEKIGRLVHIDEELLKKNKEFEQQLKKIKTSFSECQHENAALQEKLSEQLVQISALKSHIDEQKHRCSTPQKAHSFAEKIEELQEELEKYIETNKRLLVDLHESETTVSALQEEIRKKDEVISAHTDCAEKNVKRDTVYDEGESELSSIEEIQNQLVEKMKLMNATEKENKELKNENDLLKTENSSLTTLLRKAENETEMERAQVENLCEEIANITENSNEGDASLKNLITNDSKEESFIEGTQDIDPKLKSWETRIKEKNLEILMLRATVTKLESTLRLRERELELEQRRLEQDFNIVQDMMQQKEKELSTLHEETDAQMKFETEIESLEKELIDQRNVELELREEIQHLKSQLNVLENLKTENEKKDLYIKNIIESHNENVSILNKQIDLLKELNAKSEWDPTIEELVKKIVEIVNTCKINDNEESGVQEIIFEVLKKAVDSILKQMQHKHEDHIVMLNKSWQEKVDEELASKEKMFKFETENLENAFQSEKEKLNSDKDLFWKEKIKEIEFQLKNEQLKYQKLCNHAKVSKTELQGMFTNEINTLRENLESVMKEKSSLESLINDLKCELEHFKLNETNQEAILSKEYENKLSMFSKTIKETFEKEKEKIITLHQQKIDQLQKDLNLKLEKEKISEMKHKEELSALHKYFETRWVNEMKKVKDFQSEDLKSLKDSNQKILDEKLKKAEEKFAILLAEERKHLLLQHRNEIEAVQEKFKEDKRILLEEKDKALKDATDIIEKKFTSKLAEIQQKLSNECEFPGESNQKKWEEEKLKLVSSHRKDISVLKRELKNRFEKQLQTQATAHAAEIQRLEETYNKQVAEVHNMIKEAKHTASKIGYSECGSNRTTTPSSDMTSSDEACSSCREDMLSVNKQILVDKIHQDGKRVLSLIENGAQSLSYMKEAHLWLEERNWIISKLKTVSAATSKDNIKLVISNLVDEVQKFRINFETAMEENSDLKQKCDELEHQLNIQYSNLCDVNSQLKKQKEQNCDLEILISSKSSELAELQRKHSESKRYERASIEKEPYMTNSSSSGSYEIEHFRTSDPPKFARLSAEKESYAPDNENSEYSYEVGGFRSADGPISDDRFSLYHPEIDDTPSMEQDILTDKVAHIQESTIPKTIDSPLLSVHVSPPEEVNIIGNDMAKVKEELMAVFDKEIDTKDIKLHGLYWVYRRSQSYNKALIYQKKYLLMLLKDFQVTEKVTLAWLKNMNSPGSNTTLTDSFLSGRSRFRVIVFVIIALQRMKFYIRRWRHFAKIPPSHVINVEIQSVFQNYSFLSPALSPGGFHLSSHSLASMPVSLGGGDCKSSQISESSRSEMKFKNSINFDKSQLAEYVHKLETLQMQLGLDNFR